MALKKEPVKKASPTAADETPETSESKNKSTVIQVVEVIEEQTPGTRTPATANPAKAQSEAAEEEMMGETEDYSDDTEGAPAASAQSEAPDKNEKQKEVVEELFKKEKPPALVEEISVHSGRSPKGIYVWAGIVVAVALVIGGSFFLFQGGQGGLHSIFPKAAPTPTT